MRGALFDWLFPSRFEVRQTEHAINKSKEAMQALGRAASSPLIGEELMDAQRPLDTRPMYPVLSPRQFQLPAARRPHAADDTVVYSFPAPQLPQPPEPEV